MLLLQAETPTNNWIVATWEQYIALTENSDWQKAKGYYFQGQMRIETMGVGPDHALVNTILILAIHLYCALNHIPLKGLTNCTYRQGKQKEVQPDISYYIADRVSLAPQGNTIADLKEIAPPDLVIEIAGSSLSDDLGQKRLLYEEIGIREYWVIDLRNRLFYAFRIVEKGSFRISESQVIPSLKISLLAEALFTKSTIDQCEIGNWLLEKFRG